MTQQENRDKWTAALRSGKYTQTTGKLANKTGYCCLGVACEIYIANGGSLLRSVDEASSDKRVLYDYYSMYLPPDVSEWLGIDRLTQTALSEKNDSGACFDEIADIIATYDNGPDKGDGNEH